MKITVTKIKRELHRQHGWENLDCEENKFLIDCLIKDTLDVINTELQRLKNITIK